MNFKEVDPDLPPLLEVRDLVKYFPVYSRGIFRKKIIGNVHAVDHISFTVNERETVGLVGESGCGKTTTGKLILYLEKPSSGQIFFEGKEIVQTFSKGSKEEQMKLRRSMQMVFQNPYASLDPRMTVYDIISEPFKIHKHVPSSEWKERVYKLLEMVGLEPYHAERYPHEFSGGQRQRICIARALAVEPKFIIADEPVSSLDVSIRAQILNLIMELQERLGMSYLYISHDLSSVRQISQRVIVMYLGEIVEHAPTEKLFDRPVHPYTKALMSAVPIPDPKRKMNIIVLPGEVPSPINPPPGCRFHPRCQYADSKCKEEKPVLSEVDIDHFVSCHYWHKFV
ncbi:MAG: ATP-binding cassette domain-containing protein [Candidatus Methanomethylicaceae archaeon]|nr:ATP-binding cassette domain-containing protein [Candidatus Verstraetearchaeota archaeon]